MTAAVLTVAYATPSIDCSWVPDDVPVVVVVNGGGRPRIEPPRPVTWLEPGENLGFGGGVALAAAHVDADRLVLVNPDCELRPEHWDALAAGSPDEVVTVPLDSAEGPTTVASPYPGPVGLALAALRARARLRAVVGARAGTSTAGGLLPGQRAPLTSHWASGACLSVDRARFLAVGGYSDDFFLYFEDVDLSRRLGRRFPAMEVVVADVPPARHAVAASSSASGGRAELERARSAAVYAAKEDGVTWRLAGGLASRRARRLEARSGAPRAAPHAPVDVVVVSLGRTGSRGERRRARSWMELAEPGTAVELRLLDEARWPRPGELPARLVALARGRIVPEGLAWSTARARRRLEELRPSTLVVLTSRAYDPALAGSAEAVVLDYIDRLSDSYADRARVADRAGSLAWRALAVAHRRFEQGVPKVALRVAAGRRDAELLGVDYVPITSAVAEPAPPTSPDHDIAFVGNLRYPPNVEAIAELAELWPLVQERRPGTRLLLAGADPSDEVVELARRLGWTLRANFPDERAVYADTRIAVAPLLHASGIQTKVIDALRHAVPVVAYRPAAAGFEADHPIELADDRAQLVEQIVGLLTDDDRRQELGRASAAWVDRRLGTGRWRAVVAEALGRPLGAGARR